MFQQMYGEAKNMFQPYLDMGKGAITSLGALYGLDPRGNPIQGGPFNQEAMRGLENSPFYQFMSKQGRNALGHGLAGAHTLQSGNAARAFADYEHESALAYALKPYSDALAGMAEGGGRAATSLGTIGSNYAGNISNMIAGSGQAKAAGTVGGVNAITNAISGGINNYNTGYYWDKFLNNMKGAYALSGYPLSGVSSTPNWSGLPWQGYPSNTGQAPV